MAKAFEPSTLFETELKRFDRSKEPYPSEEAGLDGIVAGKKSMELLSVSLDQARPGSDLEHWLLEAQTRKLTVTLFSQQIVGLEPKRQHLDVFITHPDQLWRVPAMLALRDTALVGKAWTDASENLFGHLLGYTAKQREEWLERQHEASPAWTCTTIYALLDAKQRERVESLGRRCFGSAEDLIGFKLLWHAYELRDDAWRQLPEGTTLARVGLEHEAFMSLFGPFDRKKRLTTYELMERTLSKSNAAKISSALVSNVQFLTKRGWA